MGNAWTASRRTFVTRVNTPNIADGSKALFDLQMLKFNSHHINVAVNAWSTKCRLIAYMLV
jgi:hypothetical protein